ncbi:MAG: hypothetical protein MHMPM18_000637 [Marteilia pararefringens]
MQQIAKNNGDKTIMRDLKKSETFYKRVNEIDESGNLVDLGSKIKLYDAMLFNINCGNLNLNDSTEFTQKELIGAMNLRVLKEDKIERVLSEIYNPSTNIEEEHNNEDSEDSGGVNQNKEIENALSVSSIFSTITKNIGKQFTIQSYDTKSEKINNQKAKKAKPAKLKPGKVVENHKLEIYQRSIENTLDINKSTEPSYLENTKEQDINYIYNRQEGSSFRISDSKWYRKEKSESSNNQNELAYCLSKFSDVEYIEKLLFSNSNSKWASNFTSEFYKSILHDSCRIGNSALCLKMLENGKDVNEVDNFLWTPGHHACFNGHLDCLKLLVRFGFDMSKSLTISNSTCLHLACFSKDKDLIRYLIEIEKLDPGQENLSGETPLDLARKLCKKGQEDEGENIFDFMSRVSENNSSSSRNVHIEESKFEKDGGNIISRPNEKTAKETPRSIIDSITRALRSNIVMKISSKGDTNSENEVRSMEAQKIAISHQQIFEYYSNKSKNEIK